MAADLSKELAARQQAYALATRDRADWQTWIQRLLAGIQQQPIPPVASPAPPPATGTPPLPAPGAAHAGRIAALQKLVEMINAHGTQYADNPQAKAIMDQVTKRLTDRIAALQAGTTPAMGGWQDWLKNLSQSPAARGTPAVPGSGVPGGDAGAGGIGDTGGATGWLGDILKGFTTPVTTPPVPAVPPSTTPPAATTPPSGTTQPSNGYNVPDNPYGAGATWYSTADGGYWVPPTGNPSVAGGDQPGSTPAAGAGAPAAAQPAPSDYANWALAGQTDLNYQANLQNAAAKEADPTKKAALLAKADMYGARAATYVARVPGMGTK